MLATIVYCLSLTFVSMKQHSTNLIFGFLPLPQETEEIIAGLWELIGILQGRRTAHEHSAGIFNPVREDHGYGTG
jgi:hypothetical protein